MKPQPILLASAFILVLPLHATAGVGDPQLRTDHPWYPGELACSTFERLFATQAEVYERVTGIKPTTDEHRALASWLWRNTHYWHGEEGGEDLWGKGPGKGLDVRSREYWIGLFAHGFGLCGTTHSQWVAEMNVLLGHSRGRGVGTAGHSAFEVYLTGGAYGKGKWALLDHDLSTVIYAADGKRLLSLAEIYRDWKRLTSRGYLPGRQPWLVCGLHPSDGSSYAQYAVAEYLAGYAGPPPIVHLRRGETLRRYFEPGLEDGKTFVFWGRNYNTGGIPGPERSITWVNQPEKMYRSKNGAGFKAGQARYANAVYTYVPDFANADYREGVVEESDRHVVFEFYTPYVIAATPPNDKPWGIYDPGKNGLVLRGQVKGQVPVSVSTDGRRQWQAVGMFRDGMDLTDLVKGRRHYFLKFDAGAKDLADSGLTIVTVCQCNGSILPRLKDNGTKVTFDASNHAVVSAGPTLKQAEAHVVAGKFGSPTVTLALTSPRGESAVALHAAAHVLSSNPPRPDIKYQIEYSLDAGKTWQPLVKDWSIPRLGDEPPDFWSQSMCWGEVTFKTPVVPTGGTPGIQVRFRNSGGKAYARAEAHLIYKTPGRDGTAVTFAWRDDQGQQRHVHTFAGHEATWTIPTGRNTRTLWVEMRPVAR